jgi:hypothetical protein
MAKVLFLARVNIFVAKAWKCGSGVKRPILTWEVTPRDETLSNRAVLISSRNPSLGEYFRSIVGIAAQKRESQLGVRGTGADTPK